MAHALGAEKKALQLLVSRSLWEGFTENVPFELGLENINGGEGRITGRDIKVHCRLKKHLVLQGLERYISCLFSHFSLEF